MKNIILPTDFSDNAWKAIAYAVNLFGAEPCKYVLIHTYSIPMQNVETAVGDLYTPMEKASREELEKVKSNLKGLDIHPDSEIEILCEFGYVLSTIVRLEENGEVDYVVMGTKGASGIGEYFLGSTTAEVIEKSDSPVICVPNTAILQTPSKIAIALDSDGLKFVSSITSLMEMAKKFGAIVTFVYVVNESSDEALEVQKMDQFVIDNFYGDVKHDYLVLKGEYVEDKLTQFAKKESVDLLCMIKHKRGFWKTLFHRSMTKTMAFHSEIPLLILHD